MIRSRRVERIERETRKLSSHGTSTLTPIEVAERTTSLFQAANERIALGFTAATCETIRRAEQVADLFDRARKRKQEAERHAQRNRTRR